jgi:hypothetical protein
VVRRCPARAADSLDPEKRLAVIPEGPYVLPFLESFRPGGLCAAGHR